MNTQHSRVRVKVADFEFEVEGDPSFISEQLKSIKLQERLDQFVIEEETKALIGQKPIAPKTQLEELPQLSLPEFFNQKGRPGTTAERVTIIGYWLEHMSTGKKLVFKNDEIVNLWVETLRLPKPKTTSTLCRDAKNKGWLIPAEDKKGYWRLSLEGKDFVETELLPKSEP